MLKTYVQNPVCACAKTPLKIHNKFFFEGGIGKLRGGGARQPTMFMAPAFL